MQRVLFIGWIVLATFASAISVRAQTADDPYNIMKPEPRTRHPRPVEPNFSEPWLAPKYQSPRGSHRHVRVPLNTEPDIRTPPAVPPPIYVPDTGRLLPNLPALPGAGVGVAETGQDRALRCAHQAGVYGQAAGNREAYVGGCINQ